MIDPITIGLAIQGVKLVVNGIKSAADEAKEAFDSINECVESGKTLADSIAPVKQFFSAAGKYETNRLQLEKAKEEQEQAIERGESMDDHMSDAEYVMELMAIDRQIKQYYADIKHLFIYHFQEPGMWEEFSQRMNKLRSDREAKAEAKRRAETEKKLKEKADIMRRRRQYAKRIESFQMVLAGIVIIGIIVGFVFFMHWMIQQGGMK
jgi:tetratricopeptide (TPR) repeat protein